MSNSPPQTHVARETHTLPSSTKRPNNAQVTYRRSERCLAPPVVCKTSHGWLAVTAMAIYLMFFAPGLGALRPAAHMSSLVAYLTTASDAPATLDLHAANTKPQRRHRDMSKLQPPPDYSQPLQAQCRGSSTRNSTSWSIDTPATPPPLLSTGHRTSLFLRRFCPSCKP